MNILVTGANGQLGQLLQFYFKYRSDLNIIYTSKSQLSITDEKTLNSFFQRYKFKWVINCAAHVLADKAEMEEKEICFQSNVVGVRSLAKICSDNNTKLIHFSSDYVFDGINDKPYTEADNTNPLNWYGETKAIIDRELFLINSQSFILRTAWLYSQFGRSFVSIISKLATEKEELNVVIDQIGTPTSTLELAKLIDLLIKLDSTSFGLYHFSNEGLISWFDFAKVVAKYKKLSIKINPVTENGYKQVAKRPKYSVLSKEKVKTTFNIVIPHWLDSLEFL